LRDIQIPIALKTPALKIDIDRERAAQFGLSMADVGKAVLAATSSSRFIKPVYWLDQKSGNAYQVQIEMPQNQLKSLEQLEGIPVGNQVYLRDVASVYPADVAGEYVRYNQQRMINITANMEHMDLGTAVKDIRSIIQKLGELPKGMSILIKGQGKVLTDTLNELQSGLIIALLVIFLLIAANFQSFKISFAVLLIVISVITGALLLLWMTNNTLNIQSFMGIIMAIGVAVSNSILLLNAAENERKSGMDRKEAAISAADSRMRPILMTAIAMIAGMMPMAIGINEAGDQVAPLGIAVIGGLLFSTFSTLFILPSLYILLVKKEYQQHSLLPNEYE
jgi:multidrug efflux pump subunit AcrB